MCNLWDKQCNNNMSKHKINKVISFLKARVEVTVSGADGDKDVLSKFSCEKTSPFGGVEAQYSPRRPPRATLFSSRSHQSEMS